MTPIHWMRSPEFNVLELCEFLAANGRPLCRMYEIGSAAGESAEDFSHYFPEVHCVDPWPHPEPTDNVEASFDERMRLAGNIFKHKGLSLEIAPTVPDGTMDFVYIDGDHSYEACLADIRAWLPKLRPGAFLGGHDYQLPPVQQAVTKVFGIGARLFSDHSWIVRPT